MKTRPPSGEDVEEKDDTLIISVKLASGRFESTIHCPLFCSNEDRKRFVDSWLDLMAAGIKCGRPSKPAAVS